MFVGWIPILPGDANPEVAELLVDERAKHYWDGNRDLGTDVARTLGSGDDSAAYDIFLVYGPNAEWGDRPAASGSPVVSESAALRQALDPYLEPN